MAVSGGEQDPVFEHQLSIDKRADLDTVVGQQDVQIAGLIIDQQSQLQDAMAEINLLKLLELASENIQDANLQSIILRVSSVSINSAPVTLFKKRYFLLSHSKDSMEMTAELGTNWLSSTIRLLTPFS